MCQISLYVLAALFSSSSAIWTCTEDLDCSSLAGSVCSGGACLCPPGQQAALGGTRCVDLAPYHTSTCLESHQCSRLLTTFQCSMGDEDEAGRCLCQPGHHYFLGRCWPTIDYGEACTRDEECMGVIRNPYSLTCNGTCTCAKGYYERQRGECRKIGAAVGDGCVLDADCQFEGGACDVATFSCYDASNPTRLPTKADKLVTTDTMNILTELSRQYGSSCLNSDCPEPFECFHGSCVCPTGYYARVNGTVCLAELGSPATSAAQCDGLLATIVDGICTCPANFFFDENMRDCTRVARFITDTCVTDSNCHTFGTAARCGPPQEPWQIRQCECDPELAVWDANQQMCRLFAGIGEYCEVDSDCLAGDLEIQCVSNSEGQGICTCPEGYIAIDGLCLTTGLGLGDACQATQECTATANTVCEDGWCSCDSTGYQELDGVCAPIIGGVCEVNEDCVIENTVCVDTNATYGRTCQCSDDFVEYQDECWPAISGYGAACNVTAQCSYALGVAGECNDGHCSCIDGHHYRDGRCWPITGLFAACSRSSQCYLLSQSTRVVCRNSLCQCDFDYPYSEELHTCTGSAAGIYGSVLTIASAVLYLYLS